MKRFFFFLMNPGQKMWKEESCVVNDIFHKPLGIPLRYPGSHLGNPGWRLKPFYCFKSAVTQRQVTMWDKYLQCRQVLHTPSGAPGGDLPLPLLSQSAGACLVAALEPPRVLAQAHTPLLRVLSGARGGGGRWRTGGARRARRPGLHECGACVRGCLSRALYSCSGDARAQSLAAASAAATAAAASAPDALSTARGAPEGRRRCGCAGGGLR